MGVVVTEAPANGSRPPNLVPMGLFVLAGGEIVWKLEQGRMVPPKATDRLQPVHLVLPAVAEPAAQTAGT